MTYDFALTEAERRHAVLGKDYAVCYSERERGYMVIPLQSAVERDLLIADKVVMGGNNAN